MSSSTETTTMPAIVEQQEKQFRPSAQGWAARIGVLVFIFGGLGYVIAGLQPFWADRVALAAIYAIIGLSLNVILGYTGQVSLGHHAFVGFSAFLSAFMVTEKGQSFWMGLVVAILMGMLSAGLLGLVALRIRGLYLALITLTYGFVAVTSIFEIPALTRGGAGMPAPRPSGFVTDHEYMVLCLIFLAVVIFVDWRLLKTKVGRGILAVKQSDAIAASYGVNVTAYKVLAFMISGAIAGLAGSLFAHQTINVVSNNFQFQTSLLWVLMVVVGGLGNRTGVVIGSAFFALFPFLVGLNEGFTHWLKDATGSDPEVLSLVIGPLLALFTIIQYPGGIGEQISPITRWLRGERFTMHPEGKRKKSEGKHSPLAKLGLKRRNGHGSSDAGDKTDDPSQAETQQLQKVGASEEEGS